MESPLDQKLLLRQLDAWNVSCPPDRLDALTEYARLLVEWNRKMNLTAITSPQGIALLHFADSLSLLTVLPLTDDQRLLDVGTGAGFPGLPLKILRPALQVTLLDGLNKRLVFLREVLSHLGLTAELLHERAEEAARRPALRETFDVVTARAVAPLNVLCEYCLPFTAVGGLFAAMKGPSCPQELDAARIALRTLGGEVEQVKSLTLSDGSTRYIVLIRKVHSTPDGYPRHGGKIAKKPL